MDVERRASDRERDEVLVRLHTAYAEGRLDESELDERIDLALAARTRGDLGRVAADLPQGHADAPAPARATAGRLQVAYKGGVRRSGRWRVPSRFTSALYKSHAVVDLSAAELTGPVTVIRVIAYKSDSEIVVPPGVRVEAGGLGVSADVGGDPAPGAPVVHVQGFAYKGAIVVKGWKQPR
ncbi:DUF1707 SHOCT-like domain-containing protein [Spirillospora albida]|uniref:DUF1707 SHOCT-like domain-containing protein n=1 Tax=Spirillospora albida TaxID=58123 RepID=UPI0005699EB2|nr:DUF1707 domain-containing protein [Spirillospora albida]